MISVEHTLHLDEIENPTQVIEDTVDELNFRLNVCEQQMGLSAKKKDKEQ